MPAHRIFDEGLRSRLTGVGGTLCLGGEEARHALRVKRLRVGEEVEVMDGAGLVVAGEIRADGGEKKGRGDEVVCRVLVRGVREAPKESPAVHVCSAAPKGGRVEEMIDGLSQAGAASWTPLTTARGVVDLGEGKLERLDRIAIEACKQCGRAWRLEIGPARTLEEVLRGPGRVVMADASGEAYRPGRTGEEVRLLIGPEGGWTGEELGAAREAGATVHRFGPHVMRIETAAIVAAAVMMGACAGV